VSPIAPALQSLCGEIAAGSRRFGHTVDPARLGVLDRSGHLPLAPPGRISPNGACRLVRAADGWIAINLARDEDRALLAAWLEADVGNTPWPDVEHHAAARTRADLIERATLLGLPASAVGEAPSHDGLSAPIEPVPGFGSRRLPLKVVDLSALWAGPLCGAVLRAMGASVTKVESTRRHDPTRLHTPDFFRALNGGKQHVALDLATADGQARLRDLIAGADVLITSCRPRALPSLGLDERAVFASAPGLVWVAITGHGWRGPQADRVAFGDDASAAGGLVAWERDEPRFLGDALADPVSGLVAAAGALAGLAVAGGLVDVAMSRCAAGAAAASGLRRAAPPLEIAP